MCKLKWKYKNREEHCKRCKWRGKGRIRFFFLLIQNWRSAIFVDSRSCKSTYTRNWRWRGKCVAVVKWQQFYLVSLAWLKCPSWIRVTNLDTVTRETRDNRERERERELFGWAGWPLPGSHSPPLFPHSAPPLGWSYSACGWHFLTMCWLSIYNLRVRRSFSAHTIYLSRFSRRNMRQLTVTVLGSQAPPLPRLQPALIRPCAVSAVS